MTEAVGFPALRGWVSTPSTQHAERTLVSGSRTSTPKPAKGQIEAIRLAKTAQDTAVKGHWDAIITLKAVLVSASDGLRAQLEPLTSHKLALA
jgi:transposase